MNLVKVTRLQTETSLALSNFHGIINQRYQLKICKLLKIHNFEFERQLGNRIDSDRITLEYKKKKERERTINWSSNIHDVMRINTSQKYKIGSSINNKEQLNDWWHQDSILPVGKLTLTVINWGTLPIIFLSYTEFIQYRMFATKMWEWNSLVYVFNYEILYR